MKYAIRSLGSLALVLSCLVAVGAGNAYAGPPDDSPICTGQSFAQTFAPWGDKRYYTLATGGAAEDEAGWTLTGPARIDAGNEPFFVNTVHDQSSLVLHPGSSATTPATCVAKGYPTMRLFAARAGSRHGSLRVEVLFQTPDGLEAKTAGLISVGESWTPSRSIPVFVDADALVQSNGLTAVAFRFTPEGPGAAFRIDDVFVDPFRSR